jgi:hypothetical protein
VTERNPAVHAPAGSLDVLTFPAPWRLGLRRLVHIIAAQSIGESRDAADDAHVPQASS